MWELCVVVDGVSQLQQSQSELFDNQIIIILAGITLQGCILAALMKPLDSHKTSESKDDKREFDKRDAFNDNTLQISSKYQ